MPKPRLAIAAPAAHGTYRFRGQVAPTPGIRASILKPAVKDDVAVMRLYDPIDSWGGDWGVSAKEFAVALADIGDGVNTIELHINSPGGEVWEAVTIVNMLRDHDAKVVAVVDGMAASSASFIAAAADEVVMNRDTTAMIHDAWGLAIGNAADMRDYGDLLDRVSDTIAGVYARRGGTVEAWRAAMVAESWYTAEEAVAAGLADRVGGAARDEEAAPAARFDTTAFKHKGRADAPPPPLPVADPTLPPPDADPVTVDPADLAEGEWQPTIAARFRERALHHKEVTRGR